MPSMEPSGSSLPSQEPSAQPSLYRYARFYTKMAVVPISIQSNSTLSQEDVQSFEWNYQNFLNENLALYHYQVHFVRVTDQTLEVNPNPSYLRNKLVLMSLNLVAAVGFQADGDPTNDDAREFLKLVMDLNYNELDVNMDKILSIQNFP